MTYKIFISFILSLSSPLALTLCDILRLIVDFEYKELEFRFRLFTRTPTISIIIGLTPRLLRRGSFRTIRGRCTGGRRVGSESGLDPGTERSKSESMVPGVSEGVLWYWTKGRTP